MRQKFIVKIDPNKKLPKPKPMSVAIITDKSRSSNFDEAKAEWVIESAVDETANDFTNVCDLCHNPHLKCNFIIRNLHTGERLRVGSSCIIRFGLVKGNVDLESGVRIINNFVDEQHYTYEARIRLGEVMVLMPEAKELKNFYEALKKVVELKGIKEPTLDQLGEICYGDKWEEVKKRPFEPYRLYDIWHKPGTIQTRKSKVSRVSSPKEGSTWTRRSKSKVVYNPLSGRSNIYNTEKFVTDTKENEQEERN